MENLQPGTKQTSIKQGQQRSAKSVDTLFKTLSRNHYDLLRMVDSKATIILTVNSILISFLGALNLAPDGKREIIGIYFSVLIYFCVVSMMFALLSMIPHKYSGKKFAESNYKGSLYAGNFTDWTLDEFRSEYHRITENGETVLDEITNDIYFLGCAVKYKQRLIKASVGTLLIGLLLAGLYTYFKF